jgi:hypothetical protein
MGKAKSDENDDVATRGEHNSEDDSETETADTDSSSELEAVTPKKSEPSDNLRRRSEWFQKRH